MSEFEEVGEQQASTSEAMLELVLAQQDLEMERHIRRLQVADAAYNLARRHPVTTTVVAIAGFSLLWQALRRR